MFYYGAASGDRTFAGSLLSVSYRKHVAANAIIAGAAVTRWPILAHGSVLSVTNPGEIAQPRQFLPLTLPQLTSLGV